MNFGIWNDNWSAIQEKLKSMLVLWEYLTAWILKLPCTAGWRVRSGHVMPFRQKFKSLGISPKSPPYAQCLAPSAPTFSSPCMESAKFFNLLVTSSPKHTHTHTNTKTHTLTQEWVADLASKMFLVSRKLVKFKTTSGKCQNMKTIWQESPVLMNWIYFKLTY